jgi:hypothetical protein
VQWAGAAGRRTSSFRRAIPASPARLAPGSDRQRSAGQPLPEWPHHGPPVRLRERGP